MQSVPKQLRFPLAGVAADIDYRRATLPTEDQDYATPSAVNVVGEAAFEERLRGGSRPGLALVGSVASSGTGRWLWPNGEKVLWPTGDNVAFSTLGDSVFLPDGSGIIIPHQTYKIPSVSGAPVSASIATVYRDRLFAAAGTMWYASATGSFSDFDYSSDAGVVTRAAAGNTALAGRIAEPITALAAIDDRMLYIATARSLRLLQGEPTNGTFSVASESVGIISRDAWCRVGGGIFFIGPNGLYGITPGEPPLLLSSRLPLTLKGLASATLVADYERNGVHILMGDNTEWFYEISTKALWLQQYPVSIAPRMGGHAVIGGVNKTVFRCADGGWRMWSDAADRDELTGSADAAITSSVVIGPFRNGRRDDVDGMLDEITATLAEDSDDVQMFVHAAHSAEAAVCRAKSGIVDAEFTVKAGWNRNVRPRVRGAWCCITLASTGKWAFEGLLITTKILGRLR